MVATKAEEEGEDVEMWGEDSLSNSQRDESNEEGTWTSMPLQQVGNDKLEWLGEDLALLTLLMSASLLHGYDKRVVVRYDKRAVGVERQFWKELERVREELLDARAGFAVAKWLLVTVAGYWGNCQAFIAWQEANRVSKEDWEEGKMEDVPSNNADLDV
ncbi:hypothetical protein E4T56_gene18400 [Termitomyces sp. T112]|nr:hypothetical protein E4T56_gene18400 [Termitomyces sp. T112]